MAIIEVSTFDPLRGHVPQLFNTETGTFTEYSGISPEGGQYTVPGSQEIYQTSDLGVQTQPVSSSTPAYSELGRSIIGASPLYDDFSYLEQTPTGPASKQSTISASGFNQQSLLLLLLMTQGRF